MFNISHSFLPLPSFLPFPAHVSKPLDHYVCLPKGLSIPDACSCHFLLHSGPSVTPPPPQSQAASPTFPAPAAIKTAKKHA